MNVARCFMTRAVIAVVGGALVLAPASAASAANPIPTTAPTLVSPLYNATVNGNPILQWSAVASAIRYRVQISASSSFATVLYNVDTPGLRATPPHPDLPVGSLYWRVAATDGALGIGPYSMSQFVKSPVAGPVLSAPANGAVLAYPAQVPVLRWSALTGVKSYKVELDDADDFVGAQSFTTANTSLALPEPLILGKAYYWRVQGVSATTGVTGAFSSTWSFRTDWPVSSGKPTLLAPANDPTAEVTDVVFRWQAVAGAKSYQIQVSPNPEFANNITDDRIVKGTQYSPATTYNNATYYWRVRARTPARPSTRGRGRTRGCSSGPGPAKSRSPSHRSTARPSAPRGSPGPESSTPATTNSRSLSTPTSAATSSAPRTTRPSPRTGSWQEDTAPPIPPIPPEWTVTST